MTSDNAEFPSPARRPSLLRASLRYALAGVILLGAVAASSLISVTAGHAVVVTRFGEPVRVLSRPGLAWKAPSPIEGMIPVDLRLHTTSSGVQDVGTRDGLRVLVQAFLAWQVPDDPAQIRQFLLAAHNDPDEAARQLRSFIGSALQVVASNFDLADLVNTDRQKMKLDQFEQQLQTAIGAQILGIYGVTVRLVGVERLSLPAETLAATVARMRAERDTVAAQRSAEGLRAAAAIRSDAARDARIITAEAREQAARNEAQSREQAARIYGEAYARDPHIYKLLRSLDTMNAVVGPKTRVILRTDAAPFRALVQGPPEVADAIASAPALPTSGTVAPVTR